MKHSGTKIKYNGITAQSSGQYLVSPACSPKGIVLKNFGTRALMIGISGGAHIRDEFL